YQKQKAWSTGNDHSKNTKDDVEEQIFALPYFIELACKGETVAIDMLHAESEVDHPLWGLLKANRRLFYTKDMKSYIGYARRQANKYGIKGSRMAAVESVIAALVRDAQAEMQCKLREVWGRLPVSEHVQKVSME